MSTQLSVKRWYRLMPVFFITYSLAYLDRANFGFGAAGDMAKDLHITPAISSLLASLFFLGYFFFQVPGVYYATKRSTRKLIFWSLILWGACATATGMINNINWLIGIRFTLGIVESAVFPSMIFLLSRWFTRRERSRANSMLILGNPVTVLWMSVLSGYLIHSVGWRWMFILEGAPAILWAFFWWKLVQDKPDQVSWMTQEEKLALTNQLNLEQAGITPVKNYAQAFRSPLVILLCMQYALWSFGLYGFVLWLPSIVKSAPGMDFIRTGWLSAVPYLFAIAAMLLSSWLSDKTLNRKSYTWPFFLVGALAFYGSYLTGTNHFYFSFTLLVIAGAAMYAPYGPYFAAITEALPVNVSGGAMALINSFGALGSFAGSWLVGYLNGTTGSFSTSYLLMSMSLLLAAVLTYVAFGGESGRREVRKSGRISR